MLLQFEKHLIHQHYENWQKPPLGQVLSLDQAKNLAFLAAWQGWGQVSPNPMVGCVLLSQDRRLIGLGWHERDNGGIHAEEAAIQDAIQNSNQSLLAGSLAIVSLEPCSHHGKRPPCTELLLRYGISEVHYGLQDPDARVNGQGLASLIAAGLPCHAWEDDWQRRLRQTLEIFIHNKKVSKSFVSLKAGLSLDGSIAYRGDQRRFITGVDSRRFAHFLRLGHDSIMVGIGTLLSDNPSLTVRSLKRTKLMQKIVYDPDGRFFSAFEDRVATLHLWQEAVRVIFVTHEPSASYAEKIASLGKYAPSVESVVLDRSDFSSLPQRFYSMGLHSVLLEGGHLLYHDFLKHDLVDHAYLVMAPKVFLGGPRIFLTAQTGEPIEWSGTFEEAIRCADDLIVSIKR